MGIYDNYHDIIREKGPRLHHKPMDIGHRAKQFAPFAALQGLEETIREQEHIYVEQKHLSEDQTAELNFRLRMLQYGMRVTVTHFVPDLPEQGRGHYEITEGQVCGYDIRSGLRLDNCTIQPEYLYDLSGDGMEEVL